MSVYRCRKQSTYRFPKNGCWGTSKEDRQKRYSSSRHLIVARVPALPMIFRTQVKPCVLHRSKSILLVSTLTAPPQQFMPQVFTSTSSLVFNTYLCDDNIVDGDSYLMADYSISCTTQLHLFFRVYSGVMIFVSRSLCRIVAAFIAV